jgi:hypothetical protein
MAKPIRVTNKMKQKVQKEFAELLAGMKMPDGKINFAKEFKYEKATAVVWLTPLAYRKTMALVTGFSDEVAWHGTAIRKAMNEFVIEDVFVYPQEVTGSAVNTDQQRYTQWLYEFDDETFNKIRMQGHSHVNMGVSPSGVDSGHRDKILEQLDNGMFYIFMIWNKQLRVHTLIFDMENNTLYEDDDITVKIIGDDSLEVFLEDAKNKVQRKSSIWKKSGDKGSGKIRRNTIHEYQETGSSFDPYYGNGGYSRYGASGRYNRPSEM